MSKVTKTFVESVATLSRNASKVAEGLHAIGVSAVHKAYSGNDPEYAVYALNNIPKYCRKPLAQWFKRAGLNILEPVSGSTLYAVTGVVDKARQAKVFEAIKSRPVLEELVKARAEAKPKVLTGEVQDRAERAMGSMLKRMKESDPDAAGLINDKWTSVDGDAPVSKLFDDQGRLFALSQMEVQELISHLTWIRVSANLNTVNASEWDIPEIVVPESAPRLLAAH